MPQADATTSTTLPVTRQQIEAQVDALIDLLDTLDADPDAEPSLGWTASGGHYLETPEDLLGNANAGDDREDDDEREPGEDSEASLGWRNEGSQTGYWAGNPLVGIDLEDEHDGCEPEDDSEPDVDDEPNGGWEGDNQDSRDRFGIGFGGVNVTGQLA